MHHGQNPIDSTFKIAGMTSIIKMGNEIGESKVNLPFVVLAGYRRYPVLFPSPYSGHSNLEYLYIKYSKYIKYIYIYI
jgi:hypothetical protein